MLQYAMTPGRLAPGSGPEEFSRLLGQCSRLAAGGIDLLLLREKALAREELRDLTCRVLESVRGSAMRVNVHNDAALASACGASGTHFPGSTNFARFDEAKESFPKGWRSLSCHTLEEVRHAREWGADAILFAPVFGKMVGGELVTAGVGLERLAEACALASGVPVFALGGVNRSNQAACLRAGAAGVAGIRMFFEEP